MLREGVGNVKAIIGKLAIDAPENGLKFSPQYYGV